MSSHHKLYYNVDDLYEGKELDNTCEDSLSFAASDFTKEGEDDEQDSCDEEGEGNEDAWFWGGNALSLVIVQGFSLWTS